MFLASEKRELSGLLKHLEDIRPARVSLDYAREARLSGEPVLLAANGPGFRLAGDGANAVLSAYEHVKTLILTGFCGGIASFLRFGDVVVATEIAGEATALPVTERKYSAGPVLSQDRVASTRVEKANLAQTGAIAVEMEGGGVAGRVRGRGIPLCCVKVVTDTDEESFPIDFNEMRDSRGAFSRARIARAALRNPLFLAPKLIQFEQKCAKAARILGDFLADCRF